MDNYINFATYKYDHFVRIAEVSFGIFAIYFLMNILLFKKTIVIVSNALKLCDIDEN